MNAIKSTVFGLPFVMGSSACSVQNTVISFKQIERDAQLSARVALPDNETAIKYADGMPAESFSSSGFVSVPPKVPRPPRILGLGFFALNGLHLSLAVFDVKMTQHRIAVHHCREGNPLMPSSLTGQLGVGFALVGYGAVVSYELKKRDNDLWPFSPGIGIATQTVSVATGFAHYYRKTRDDVSQWHNIQVDATLKEQRPRMNLAGHSFPGFAVEHRSHRCTPNPESRNQA